MKLRREKVRLRAFRLSDAPRLAQLANNERISDNLRDAFPHPYTLTDAHRFIDSCLEQDPATRFVIEFEGAYVGTISLEIGQDVYRRSAEIGYFIGEPFWNKGIASRAVRIITEYGFNELHLVRIYTAVFEYNPASMRVLEKCGYRKEGIFEKAIVKKGKIWDEHRFAIINPKYA